MVTKLNYRKSLIDVCLLMKQFTTGSVIVCIYVDDLLFVGHENVIQQAITELQAHYSLKQEGQLREYVGCMIIQDKVNNQLWLWQPTLLKEL